MTPSKPEFGLPPNIAAGGYPEDAEVSFLVDLVEK